MPGDELSDVTFEIGHVLFVNIVGFSTLLITEQTNQVQTLKEIVRSTEQFRKEEAERKLLRLPTDYGGALVSELLRRRNRQSRYSAKTSASESDSHKKVCGNGGNGSGSGFAGSRHTLFSVTSK